MQPPADAQAADPSPSHGQRSGTGGRPAPTQRSAPPDETPAPDELPPAEESPAESTPAESTPARTSPAEPVPTAQPSAESTPAGALTDREREILTFERQWWKHAGAKEQAIRDRFDLSATRYYQLLNALLDNPAALAADPMVVGRLRRLRATRARNRRR